MLNASHKAGKQWAGSQLPSLSPKSKESQSRVTSSHLTEERLLRLFVQTKSLNESVLRALGSGSGWGWGRKEDGADNMGRSKDDGSGLSVCQSVIVKSMVLYNHHINGAGEMAWCLRIQAALPKDQGSIPSNHIEAHKHL